MNRLVYFGKLEKPSNRCHTFTGVNMHKRIYLFLTAILLLSGSIFGADLYQVKISNQADADELRETNIDPVVAIQGGYLVLAEANQAQAISLSGIKLLLVEKDISLDELAIDLRFDDLNRSNNQIIFEENGLRIFRMTTGWYAKVSDPTLLMPVNNRNLKIEYYEQSLFETKRIRGIADLMTLINLVVTDSLYSYDSTLQAYGNRYVGTASNNLSRDWLADKFTEFGLDSIVIENFTAGSYGPAQNVIAYKIGTSLPDHHVVVGAHRDAVSSSPGADDNGSGSAAVLEIARILKDYDTDLTFVFVLFDAEEQGLYGSYHYAEEAVARGDSIVFMCNMDMIGYYDNDSQAKLYHGTEMEYTYLFQHLADSLLNLTASLAGVAGNSDHHPFIQNGYQAAFLHEYVFSTVYHSPQDSTSYMNFDYMAKMVKASLATVFVVSETYIPGPELRFNFPDGLPTTMAPDATTSFGVIVSGINDGTPISGSGLLHYSINGAGFSATSMTELLANQYQAELPGLSCGDQIDFYFSAEEVDSGLFYAGGPGSPYSAAPSTGQQIQFSDDFETDLGWAVSGGSWSRGNPTGGGGSYGGPDPVGGYNSSTAFCYNLSGDYGNNIPEYHLTSPAIDCSDIIGTHLVFQSWLGVEQPTYDHAYIKVSSNGSSWTTVWANSAEVTDYAWSKQDYDISALADGQATVFIRFTMGETDGGWTYCGWNIDDLVVKGQVCDAVSPLTIITETIPDWTADYLMTQQLLSTGGTGTKIWTDKNNDLSGTGLTLSTSGLLSGTPSSAGEISFTAMITDDESSVEQLLTFEINPALNIANEILAEGIVDEPYSVQLSGSGGTGGVIWSDKNNDLTGTGLTLSASGLVNGTPLSTGTIDFTSRIEDGIGAIFDKPLQIVVTEFICDCFPGDANDDGIANVGDAVYLINFVFKSGENPIPYASCSGDANGDCIANVGDAVYLIGFVFKGGSGPVSCDGWVNGNEGNPAGCGDLQ